MKKQIFVYWIQYFLIFAVFLLRAINYIDTETTIIFFLYFTTLTAIEIKIKLEETTK